MGFLIDAVTIRLRFRVFGSEAETESTLKYLAEIIHLHQQATATAEGPPVMQTERPVLSMVVWILKREVRASGECLGMYRR